MRCTATGRRQRRMNPVPLENTGIYHRPWDLRRWAQPTERYHVMADSLTLTSTVIDPCCIHLTFVTRPKRRPFGHQSVMTLPARDKRSLRVAT